MSQTVEMCPSLRRRQGSALSCGGFTLLELMIVLVIIGVVVVVGAGSFSIERNPLHAGAQTLITATSTARGRALMRNTNVTLELNQTFMILDSGSSTAPIRESFPAKMTAISVNGQSLLGNSRKLIFHPLGVIQEHVIHLQSGLDTLSVYIPATGTARILEGSYSLEQIRKEFL